MMQHGKLTENSAEATIEAARGFSRRLMLARSAAVGTVAAVGPWVVREANASSGKLSLLVWDDEQPNPVIPDFEKATGIKVTTTPFSQNEEQINKLQATQGEGFDLCQPTHDRAPQFQGTRPAGSVRRKASGAGQPAAEPSAGFGKAVALGRQAVSHPALLGQRGDQLAQRQDQAGLRDPQLRLAVG